MLKTVYKPLLRDVKEPLHTERHEQLTRRDSCHVPSLICNKALKFFFFFSSHIMTSPKSICRLEQVKARPALNLWVKRKRETFDRERPNKSVEQRA